MDYFDKQTKRLYILNENVIIVTFGELDDDSYASILLVKIKLLIQRNNKNRILHKSRMIKYNLSLTREQNIIR